MRQPDLIDVLRFASPSFDKAFSDVRPKGGRMNGRV